MTNYAKRQAASLLATGGSIKIVAGEGELGTMKDYTGRRTMRAIRAKLRREECGGDRWAKALIADGENETGKIWVNLFTLEDD